MSAEQTDFDPDFDLTKAAIISGLHIAMRTEDEEPHNSLIDHYRFTGPPASLGALAVYLDRTDVPINWTEGTMGNPVLDLHCSGQWCGLEVLHCADKLYDASEGLLIGLIEGVEIQRVSSVLSAMSPQQLARRMEQIAKRRTDEKATTPDTEEMTQEQAEALAKKVQAHIDAAAEGL